MLSELVNKSRQMKEQTGNHIDSCINKVAHSLSASELLQLASETDNARFIKQATYLVEHGADYSNDDAWSNRKEHHAHVAIIADGFIRAANRNAN